MTNSHLSVWGAIMRGEDVATCVATCERLVVQYEIRQKRGTDRKREAEKAPNFARTPNIILLSSMHQFLHFSAFRILCSFAPK